MPKLPVVSGKDFIKFLESISFNVINTKGSHVRLKAEDGRLTTIPVHRNKPIPKGLLRKIIRDDPEITLDEFLQLYSKY
jgi:predicted RNA binding protein YcfA (HicA-like mRNA interferase family)